VIDLAQLRLRRRLFGGFAAAMVAASLLTSCTTARTDVGTADESCYLSLPAATRAVGGHGHLEGIRKFTAAQLRQTAPRLYQDLLSPVPPRQDLCVAAFTGQFTSAEVTKALGRNEGVFAVVVLTTPANRLLGTLILRRVPVRINHTHPF
jgi:hypothetical protein